jgi:hypothetical protein
MIQRKQSLFLIALAFLGIILLFLPTHRVQTNTGITDVCLVPINNEHLTSTAGHLTAVALNFVGIVLAFVALLIFKRRQLQIKLCYGLMIIWLILTMLISFASFVVPSETVIAVQPSYVGIIVGVGGMLCSYLAARFVKRDIELIKSADRIR